MAEAPVYFRFFIDDYLRDAEELSIMQTGAYMRLMLWYYARAKPIPNDLPRIYARTRAKSTEDEISVRWVLEEFFRLDGNVWRHKRIDEEIAHWRGRTEAAIASANNRWEKFNRNKGGSDAIADRSQCEGNANQNQNQNQKDLKNSLVRLTPDVPVPTEIETPKGKALRDAAKRVLARLNLNAGRRYDEVDANLKPIIARIQEGYSEQELCAITAVKARQWKGDERMDAYLRPKTLFNATNAAQYRGELPTKQIEESTK